MKHADIYLSAEALRIPQQLRDDVIWFLSEAIEGKLHIDMRTFQGISDCGTTACIAGHIAIRRRKDSSNEAYDLANFNGSNFRNLCYPCIEPYISLYQAALPQAIRAVTNYLTTGDAKWAEIIAEAAK